MKTGQTKNVNAATRESQVSELLILPDGRILVHNLTQPFAELLWELNPDDEQIGSRVTRHLSSTHELPN